MNFVSRTDLLKLTGDTDYSFDGKLRNQRVPDPQPSVKDRKRGKYTPLEALTMIIANQLCEGENRMHQSQAAGLASRAYFIVSKMEQIAKTSEQPSESAPDIFVSWIKARGPEHRSETVAVCGTFSQIVTEYPSPLSIVPINVSHCARVMRRRARNNKINIDDFWTNFTGQIEALAVHHYDVVAETSRRRAAAKRTLANATQAQRASR